MEEFVEGLTDYQQAFLRKYPYPQLFAIISWGCAATAWLATVLNRHPDIYCVHEANQAWHVLGNVARLDGIDYLRVIGKQGHSHLAAGDVHGSALQTKKVNIHAGRHPRCELSDWQIGVMRKIVDPRAWEAYEALGYARPGFVTGNSTRYRTA